MKRTARSQKRLTKASNPGFKTTTAAASTWASCATRGLPKRGRCEVGELEQGNDGICLLAVDAGAHARCQRAGDPAIPLAWCACEHYSRSCVFPQRPAGPSVRLAPAKSNARAFVTAPCVVFYHTQSASRNSRAKVRENNNKTKQT